MNLLTKALLLVVCLLSASLVVKRYQGQIESLKTDLRETERRLDASETLAAHRLIARQVADARLEKETADALRYGALREELAQKATGYEEDDIPDYLGDVLDGLRRTYP